uniref:Conserved secreted protein n=1 Tax=Panagrellus redivivus TaxID=6233 RepID=A0A7E4VB99_PANRE
MNVVLLLLSLFTPLALAFDCSLYTSLEAKAHCGDTGYLIGYGNKYCNRFNEKLHYFNKKGQQWVACTAKCLQDEMKKIVDANPGQCETMHTQAFESHVQCYVSCGFCGVYASNLRALWKTYDLKDFASKTALKQVMSVGAKCIG